MNEFLRRYLMLLLKPDDEGAGGEGISTDHDGSLLGAAGVMPDIEALERQQEQPNGNAPPASDPGAETPAEKAARERDDKGRFKAKSKDGEELSVDPAKAADGQQKVADGEDEEDYLELPPEQDGGEPQRLKITEVYDGYQRAKSLETELTELKAKSAAMPVEMERATEELVTQMSHYQQAVQKFAAMQSGKEPDLDLLNPQSDNYNPEQYAQEKLAFERGKAARNAAKTEFERVNGELAQHQERLAKARFEREQGKLKEFWPELIADEAVQAKVQADALKHFGITREDFNALVDHRHYKVLKAALAHVDAAAATERAIKVVKAKPKLVKGSARQTGNAKDAQHSEAVDKLINDPNSLDHAAGALDKFLH